MRNRSFAIHAKMIATMAGAEAEIVLLGAKPLATSGKDLWKRIVDPREPQNDFMDLGAIASLAEDLLGYDYDEQDFSKLEPRLRRMTRRLVRRHKDKIKRVAKALLAKTTLSAKQIDKLVGRSVDDVKVNAPSLLAMSRRTA